MTIYERIYFIPQGIRAWKICVGLRFAKLLGRVDGGKAAKG